MRSNSKEISSNVSSVCHWRALLSHPVLLVLLVGLIAMGGALKADFYMDDYGFILNRSGDAPMSYRLMLGGVAIGSEAAEAREITVFQLLPTLMTSVTNAWFPMNSTAAHLWNLLIHLALSAVVFVMGKRFLAVVPLVASPAARHEAALTGALLFACHPLGTEPVHYAKCHMVALVALFSFMATCAAAEFFAARGRRGGGRCLVAGGLCMISYFPGTVLLGVNLLVLLLHKITRQGISLGSLRLAFQTLRGRPRAMATLVFGVAVHSYPSYFFLTRFYQSITSWDEYFPRHLATQGRVFWEYLQRMVIPTGLSSDHYQPWSTFGDPGTLLKFISFVLLIAAASSLAFRRGSGARRGVGLLVLLSVIPLTIRLLYVSPEIMVEYRAYSALPWFCLLIGCGCSIFRENYLNLKRPWLRWVPASAVIAVFTFLSLQRGLVWRSSRALAADALAQYPLNNRPRTQLQFYDFHAGRYAAVLDRHEELLLSIEEIGHFNKENNGSVLVDGFRANTNLISSFQLAIYARAELEGRLKALAYADNAIALLNHQHPAWSTAKPGQAKAPLSPLFEARTAVSQMDGPGL